MKLARKLQLAYLALMLIPFLTVGSLMMVSYYAGGTNLGPYADMDAPGWIKSELATIFDEDWARYGELKERIIIFIMKSDGYLLFPQFSESGLTPELYPYFNTDESIGLEHYIGETGLPIPDSAPAYLPDVFERFGTDWTLDLTFTPVVIGDEKYLVGWRTPIHGVPGFIARRGWMMPLLFLTGIMLIPALIDARLRKSIRRLQDATSRLSGGNLDEPIQVLKRDDLSDLAASLESTRLELKDSRDRKARFLMAVSHDLRTPLTSIKGYIEALGDGMAENADEFEQYVAVLEDKTTLLEGRIDELIDFARSDSGGWTRPDSAIDIPELITNLNASFAKDCGFAERIYASELNFSGATGIHGDSRALYRAWENIFTNALRHTAKGDPIVFRVGLLEADEASENPLRTLYGEIEDGGDGVPEDFIPLLFEPFARGDRGRNTRGLGLGLASVKAVAEAHGGAVEYSPREGGGSIFRITLPCSSPL